MFNVFQNKKLKRDLETIKSLETKFKINEIKNYKTNNGRVTDIHLGHLKIKNEDLGIITRLDALELLNLDYNHISSIKALGSLKKLKRLSLVNNHF